MLDEVKELQNNAVMQLLDVVSRKNDITFKAPTGSGKTFIMAKFMDEVLSKRDDVVFIVSSLSKAKLAEQNYSKFKEYLSLGLIKHINPYLINSEDSGENALYIPSTENVYVLPRDLYKEKSKLKSQQAFLKFLLDVKNSNTIILIKDECHIATNKLDELKCFFSKTINISATPKKSPDVQIKETDAISVNLIKKVKYQNVSDCSDEFTPECVQYNQLSGALDKFISLKKRFEKFGINPCMIIQISNKDLGVKQVQTIEYLLNSSDYKDLKWISVADDPKLCNTNDQLIKSSPKKWEKYAIPNASLIDIIIFKMKITEGWDIPRANMLFQIRDSHSVQLDEQVLGRVRRNPMLLDFDKIKSYDDMELLTTAYVWGLKPSSQNNELVEVKLKGDIPDSQGNEIQNEFKLNVTVLEGIKEKDNDFDLENFLKSVSEPKYKRSIFDLYDDLIKSSDKVQETCFDYISLEQDNAYHSFFDFVNHLSEVKQNISSSLTNYQQSIKILKNNDGSNLEVSFPYESLYFKNRDCSLTVKQFVWENDNAVSNFYFDSEAEVQWLNNMLNDFAIKSFKLRNCSEVLLIGKNYLPNSMIRYEYYNNGRHFSYPDFVLKNKYNRYFIFEVKSFNSAAGMSIDFTEYNQKVECLKEFYMSVSRVLPYYFCIPVLKGITWNVTCNYAGRQWELGYSDFKEVINSEDDIIFDMVR